MNEFEWRQQMRNLRRPVTPGRDLWDAIDAALERREDDAAPTQTTRRAAQRPWLLAAALACVFLLAGGIGLRVRADREDAAGPYLRVEIEDTGPGISPEDQDKLFRQFEQTKTGQQAGTGTGLGLSIVHRIIDAHHGRLVIRNREHAGAVMGAMVEMMVPVA